MNEPQIHPTTMAAIIENNSRCKHDDFDHGPDNRVEEKDGVISVFDKNGSLLIRYSVGQLHRSAISQLGQGSKND